MTRPRTDSDDDDVQIDNNNFERLMTVNQRSRYQRTLRQATIRRELMRLSEERQQRAERSLLEASMIKRNSRLTTIGNNQPVSRYMDRYNRIVRETSTRMSTQLRNQQLEQFESALGKPLEML